MLVLLWPDAVVVVTALVCTTAIVIAWLMQ